MEDYRRRSAAVSPALTSREHSPLVSPLPADLPAGKTAAKTTGVAEQTGEKGESHSVRLVILSLVFYSFSSLGAIFINKACLTHYRFTYPSTLMVLQSALTIVLLSVLGRVKPNWVCVVTLKRSDIKKILIPTVFFVANVTIGLSALEKVNIPMFSAFRRLTVLFVLVAEFVMLNKKQSKKILVAVVVLTIGAFVSALGDVTFTYLGYTLVFANNLLTALYLATIKRFMRDMSLDPISLLYYTSVLGFPIILSIAWITNDLQQALQHFLTTPQLYNSPLFIMALSFVSASAFCVNLSTSLCTHYTSPLTTSVTGQVKNVLQSLLGFFSWGYIPTPLNVIGLLVALSGQIAFAYFKYNESHIIKSTTSPNLAPSLTSSSTKS